MWSEKRADCSPGSFRLQSVTGTHSSPPQSFCHAERLNEEPDMGKPFVRFCEGLRHNWCMGEILWHRRETRRQTENTNVTPTALEDLSLLDKYCVASSCRSMIIAEQSTEALPSHHWTHLATNFPFLRDQLVVENLMIALRMIVGQVLVDRII